MIRKIVLASLVAGMSFGLVGCQSSSQEGVKSSWKSQWAEVMADTTKTTDAAKSVFEAEGLRDVTAASTKIDGKATGKTSDGTVITADVRKKSDTMSEVTVQVGWGFSAERGAELVKKIKNAAEGK